MDYGDFEADEKTIFAVIRALEIIGEATKHIPEDIRENNPLIPWKDMAGMRDVLIHDYVGVDIKTVWLTIQERLNEIKPHIQQLLDI